jgi:hypothetical protein
MTMRQASGQALTLFAPDQALPTHAARVEEPEIVLTSPVPDKAARLRVVRVQEPATASGVLRTLLITIRFRISNMRSDTSYA